MGFLKELPKVLESKRVRRWYTILEADASLDAPAVEVNIAYLDPQRNEQLQSSYKKKKGEPGLDLDGNKGKNFKWDILKDIVAKGFTEGSEQRWRGVTKTNLRRLCPAFMTYPELLEDLPAEDEIPFTTEDLQQVAKEMADEYFLEIYRASEALNDFVASELKKT